LEAKERLSKNLNLHSIKTFKTSVRLLCRPWQEILKKLLTKAKKSI